MPYYRRPQGGARGHDAAQTLTVSAGAGPYLEKAGGLPSSPSKNNSFELLSPLYYPDKSPEAKPAYLSSQIASVPMKV